VSLNTPIAFLRTGLVYFVYGVISQITAHKMPTLHVKPKIVNMKILPAAYCRFTDACANEAVLKIDQYFMKMGPIVYCPHCKRHH